MTTYAEAGEQIPPWLSRQIHDLLAWDRQTWDIDPSDGWDPVAQRFTT